MHYVRFLRPPKVVTTGRNLELELLFTITTDLGDSFLFPEQAVRLSATILVYGSSEDSFAPLSASEPLSWKPGQRVSKPTLRVPEHIFKAWAAGHDVQICITANPGESADGVREILQSTDGGLVMPAWVQLNHRDQGRHMTTRKLQLGNGTSPLDQVQIDEEIGESIARHIWDAGVAAMCAIAGAVHQPELKASQGPCVQAVKDILSSGKPLDILELGCGVGILGLGVASLCSVIHRNEPQDCTVLMTDLEEAESQARENMTTASQIDAQLLYENLDWDDGRNGRFGPTVTSRPWDLIMLSDCTYNVDMLPALVKTLSALHAANGVHRERGTAVTKVFLATKPRHSSERGLFDLLAQHQWMKCEEQIIPLPAMGSEPESVELYLFEKK